MTHVSICILALVMFTFDENGGLSQVYSWDLDILYDHRRPLTPHRYNTVYQMQSNSLLHSLTVL